MSEPNRILKVFRDPLWQFLGVAVTLALFVLQSYVSGQSGEIRVTLAASSNLISGGTPVPGVTHKTEIAGNVADNYKTVSHIFVIQNKSSRALIPAEIGAPVLLTPAYSSKILLVYAFPAAAGAPAIASQQNSDGTWSISAPLLNPDAQLEIVVYVQSDQLSHVQDYSAKETELRNSAPTVFWQVPNTKTNIYASVDQVPYSVDSFNPLNVSIILYGKGIFQVLIVFALLHYISALLSAPISSHASSTVAALIGVALPLLSISAAESVHHLFIRDSSTREALGTSPLNYVILGAWLAVHSAMGVNWIRTLRSSAS